jgi:hypothetical protein
MKMKINPREVMKCFDCNWIGRVNCKKHKGNLGRVKIYGDGLA